MLTSFKAIGFKSLRDVSFEPGLVNVFIGANGSGKSSLLEAIGVLGAAAFRSVEPETLRYRGVRPGLPALYKSSFEPQAKEGGGAAAKARGIRRVITLECEGKGVLYRVGLDNPVDLAQRPWRILSETLRSEGVDVLTRSPTGCYLHQTPDDRLQLDPPKNETAVKAALQQVLDGANARRLVEELIDYAVFSPTTPALRGLEADVSRNPVGLAGSGLPLAVKDLLSPSTSSFGPFELETLWEMIDWADDVSVVSSQHAAISPAVSVGPTTLRFRDRFMRKGRNTLSAYDASEGALYVLFLLTLAVHPRAPRVFAVDNFDHALHPRLAARLMREVTTQLLADEGRQMLLTTHNPLVLDGLDLTDDRVRLFAVERERDGRTQVRRVSLTSALLAETQRGLSLSRLWVMGRLGGVPANL